MVVVGGKVARKGDEQACSAHSPSRSIMDHAREGMRSIAGSRTGLLAAAADAGGRRMRRGRRGFRVDNFMSCLVGWNVCL